MAPLPEPRSPTREAIFAAYEADRDDGFRPHLGASLIGKSCERALWYDFRWVTPARFPGRILRLFETGQLEEARLVRNLRRTGATVLDVDPSTGRQWRVEAHGGHFGGSLDAVAVGLIEAPRTWHVVEFKTHSAKSFRELAAKGVGEAKPQHAAQMQVYMHLTGLTRALYVAVCKDTDDLHVERVSAVREAGERLLAKAKRVIDATRPPSRISDDPAWWECRLCSHHAVCHDSASVSVTCRSCLHASPVEGGWHCARWDAALDTDAQRAACAKHLFIPDLVPGDVADAGDDHVVYQLPDGTIWINDAREAIAC
ncbi:PD-(D/E)XK nuclease family protein [Acuticoccus yangtzensis]|uniref:PD-(D/E)XK nuclease family protein n=1 Tax=Acuticoccus yangtzensis TaxID=1443441 RepID=UPI0009497FB3|nr:PD-(D/E)XK nuclease family protein [Acuticoccus yangtzensis]